MSSGYSIDRFLVSAKRKNISVNSLTVPVTVGKLGPNLEVVILNRGHAGSLVPFKVNYQANFLALQKLGVTKVISTANVGSLHMSYQPGDLVLIDQFIDFTKKRPATIFPDTMFKFMDFTSPYCPSLRKDIQNVVKELKIELKLTGCYFGFDGPRYQTAAEVKAFRLLGGDVVGQTSVTEAIYARELQMCFATIALVTNRGAGIGSSVTIEKIKQTVNAKHTIIEDLLYKTLKKVDQYYQCQCIPQTATVKT